MSVGGELDGVQECPYRSTDHLDVSSEAQFSKNTNEEVGLTMHPPDDRHALRMKTPHTVSRTSQWKNRQKY